MVVSDTRGQSAGEWTRGQAMASRVESLVGARTTNYSVWVCAVQLAIGQGQQQADCSSYGTPETKRACFCESKGRWFTAGIAT